MNKFKVNDVVLYQHHDDLFELGIIKEVIASEERAYLKQQGFPFGGEPKGAPITVYRYRVWFHTGDTTALTAEHLLKPITNDYAFSILRRSANTEIDLNPCKQFAAELLGQSKYFGDDYYAMEDWLTHCLGTQEVNDRPKIKSSLYYYLMDEIRYHLEDIHDIKDVEDERVAKMADNICNKNTNHSLIFLNNSFDIEIRDYLREEYYNETKEKNKI